MDIRINLFSVRVMRHWSRLPREVVESLPLEAFKSHVDAALKDTVRGHGCGGLTVGPGNHRGLFQP